jgi:hypothetical protein
VAATQIPCLIVCIVLIGAGLPSLVAGLMVRNRYKRVLKVNQVLFFWIGRDRVVLNVGMTCAIVGLILTGLGTLGMWLWTRMVPC